MSTAHHARAKKARGDTASGRVPRVDCADVSQRSRHLCDSDRGGSRGRWQVRTSAQHGTGRAEALRLGRNHEALWRLLVQSRARHYSGVVYRYRKNKAGNGNGGIWAGRFSYTKTRSVNTFPLIRTPITSFCPWGTEIAKTSRGGARKDKRKANKAIQNNQKI